ncbi:Coq4 family protein [Thermoleptolyngbya sp. C42_A2020_037]|uniref:Coq4 family protein n=1 Tax=Thermoleptolyngbya sp. C42_A2020_037 TaxID=2747799 RepID=UPI0019F70089|nr:Coq4 family protein [Thermoleptolyngbya sp. C42_A2020_037]MBF2086637.1 ubiquinone biosynthesis protein [Thermoleptolyngbya sp. C42_A2020_037]
MKPLTSAYPSITEIRQPLATNPFPSSERDRNVQFLTMLKAFFSLLAADADTDLTAVDELSLSLVDSDAYRLAAAEMQRDPDVAALIHERYQPPAHDLDRLITYPIGSLGQVYATMLQDSGFERIEMPLDLTTDTAYVEYRWQQTHDLWHVVTGFGTDEISEIGLQAFYLAQFRLPLAGMLVANALIGTTLLTPEAMPDLLRAIALGWELGEQAKPLFAQRWEEAWEKPVRQWRAELGLPLEGVLGR